MTITAAKYDDFASVYSLYAVLMGKEPAFSEKEYGKFLDEKAQHLALVKDASGSAIGLIAWRVWPAALSFREKICFIQDVIVVPEHRGEGLGSSLIKHVKDWARSQGIKVVHAQTDKDNNESALRFYQRNGFEARNLGLFSRIQHGR